MSSFKSSESRKVDSPATPKKPDTDSQWLAIERKEQSSAWLRDNEYILEGHPNVHILIQKVSPLMA